MIYEKFFRGNTVEEKVAAALNVVKAPFNLKGYDYLCSALIIATEDRGSVCDITKDIYERIARKVSKERHSIIAAMSYLIRSVCDSGELERLNEYLGERTYDNNVKPTNSDFISRIAAEIRFELKNNL